VLTAATAEAMATTVMMEPMREPDCPGRIVEMFM
jgi:hypothetical protein